MFNVPTEPVLAENTVRTDKQRRAEQYSRQVGVGKGLGTGRGEEAVHHGLRRRVIVGNLDKAGGIL